MTQVYNYFALPPARAEFCDAALAIASDHCATPKPDAIDASPPPTSPQFEARVREFFTAYEQYRRDSAAWDARYGARYGASQPGYRRGPGGACADHPAGRAGDPASTSLQPIAGRDRDRPGDRRRDPGHPGHAGQQALDAGGPAGAQAAAKRQAI